VSVRRGREGEEKEKKTRRTWLPTAEERKGESVSRAIDERGKEIGDSQQQELHT